MYVYVNISITRICLRKPDWTRLVGPTLKLFEEKKIQSGTQFLKKKKKKKSFHNTKDILLGFSVIK